VRFSGVRRMEVEGSRKPVLLEYVNEEKEKQITSRVKT